MALIDSRERDELRIKIRELSEACRMLLDEVAPYEVSGEVLSEAIAKARAAIIKAG